jgi:predicted outer membrane repeat protein
MTRCTVSDNHAPDGNGSGGGIACIGRMTLTDCVIETNTATNSGGGLILSADPGALSSTLLGSTMVRGNTAGFGGGIYVNQGTLEIAETCGVTDNTAQANRGGGINNGGGAVILQGAAPAQIVIDNCVENCVGAVPGCDAAAGTCP